jgi:hypothetical protein
MRYPDPRLSVEQTPLGSWRKLPSPKSEAAAPFYERPWRLKTVVPSDPAECDCLEHCQSELMHLLKALASYQVEP